MQVMQVYNACASDASLQCSEQDLNTPRVCTQYHCAKDGGLLLSLGQNEHAIAPYGMHAMHRMAPQLATLCIACLWKLNLMQQTISPILHKFPDHHRPNIV